VVEADKNGNTYSCFSKNEEEEEWVARGLGHIEMGDTYHYGMDVSVHAWGVMMEVIGGDYGVDFLDTFRVDYGNLHDNLKND